MKSKAILTSLAVIALLAGCEKKPIVEKGSEQAKSAAESAREATKSAAEAAKAAVVGKAFVKENPQASTLRNALNKYEKDNTPPNEVAVDQAITDLNGKIAELQEKAAKSTGAEKEEVTSQVKSLTEFRNEETARFAKAKTKPTPSEGQSSLQKLEEGVSDAGEALRETAENAGEALMQAGEALKPKEN